MATRVIRINDDPILRKKSRPVEKFDSSLQANIDDMFETMYENDGVGLAAVQVGMLRQIIVIDDYEETKLTIINPKIVESEGEEEGLEGCLSVPERIGKVNRYTDIKVKYQNELGEEKSIEASGFLARILQHEIDHLSGILYTDLATEMYRVDPESQEESSEETEQVK